jgi:cell division protein FtsA
LKHQQVLGLDIGSGKIAAVLCEVDSKGSFYIKNIGTAPSVMIKKGAINPDSYSESLDSIREAVYQAIGKTKKKIPALVTQSGHALSIRRPAFQIKIKSKNPVVEKKHIHSLQKMILQTKAPGGEQVLHHVPGFFEDQQNELMSDPLGARTGLLSQNCLVISMQRSKYMFLEKALKSFAVDMRGILYAPVATAQIMLTSEEINGGVLLIEIGSEVTSINLFQGGRLILSEQIYVAGRHIEADIAYALKITTSTARELLFKYAQIMPDKLTTQKIEVSSMQTSEKYFITHGYLGRIVQARVHEIFSLVWKKLESFKTEMPLPRRLVVAGGVSLLEDIDVFASKLLNIPARRGIPEDKWDLIDDPLYATALGSVLYGLDQGLFRKKSWF